MLEEKQCGEKEETRAALGSPISPVLGASRSPCSPPCFYCKPEGCTFSCDCNVTWERVDVKRLRYASQVRDAFDAAFHEATHHLFWDMHTVQSAGDAWGVTTVPWRYARRTGRAEVERCYLLLADALESEGA